MDINDIKLAIDNLAIKDRIFQVEDEFRHYFVNELESLLGADAKIGYEFEVAFVGTEPMFEGKRVFIDLIIIHEDKWYPIEIKYFRKDMKFGKLYNLKTDSVPHSFDYVSDIRRLELFKSWCKKEKVSFGRGYAIVLSNNNDFYKSEAIKSSVQNYDDFQLRDEEKLTNVQKIWFKTIAKKYQISPHLYEEEFDKLKKHDQVKYVELDNSYTIKWEKYKMKNPIEGFDFKYMIQEVK